MFLLPPQALLHLASFACVGVAGLAAWRVVLEQLVN